jgi:hypothetical protein
MPILLAIRNELRTLRTEMHSEFHDVKVRLSGLERHYVIMQSSLDRVQEHLQRVDRRLELHED